MAVKASQAANEAYDRIVNRQRRSAFIPQVGGFVVVQFPGETMRCEVKSVVDDDAVIVEIGKPPISRMHTFRFEEKVGVRRRVGPTGSETWEAQQDRDFLAEQRRMQEMANPTPPKAVAPAPKPVEPKKVAQVKPEPKKKPPAKAKAKAKAHPKRKAAAK
jgi:hypothetical protein